MNAFNPGKYRAKITFQRNTEGDKWDDYITVSGYINGVSGNEFFIANAGYEAGLAVSIECRYQPLIMKINPMEFRAVSEGIVYELISPPDDLEMRHRFIKFRGRRVYTGGEYDDQ